MGKGKKRRKRVEELSAAVRDSISQEFVKRGSGTITVDAGDDDPDPFAGQPLRKASPRAAEDRKAAKRAKWTSRAVQFGIDYGALTKVERREFRVRWRAVEAFDNLEKVERGLAKRAPSSGDRTPPPFAAGL